MVRRRNDARGLRADYVCVSLHQTKRAYVCSRVCDREYAALRACINSFQCVPRVCGWDSWTRVRVSVCACIEVGVRGNGKGSRGTITEPRFRATTRRHPFSRRPLRNPPIPCSKPTGNPPLCFISFSLLRFFLLTLHLSRHYGPLAKRTKT